MGLFLQAALALDRDENAVREALAEAEKAGSMDVVAAECQCRRYPKGTAVLLNEGCVGYEELAEMLSEELNRPVLLLYIYDEDFWGYFFYERGMELDRFQTIPDYFEEASEEEALAAAGDSGLVAGYFGVKESEIEKYLAARTGEVLDDCEGKAYDDDEFAQCDCWQMADFMRKLGFPYEFS